MTSFDNVDRGEIEKFDKVSQIWWDPDGEMGTLHTINPLRTNFVFEGLPVSRPKILDVGCGGGILSEALARAGMRVVGIDLSEPAIQVARQHARDQGLEIDYRVQSVDEIASKNPGTFDAVTCMEMLEHVPDPAGIVSACAKVLKPGGQAFFSTINRTLKALISAIVVGEYILRLLPRGTHTYRKLIQPRELKSWAQENGLAFSRISSLIYNPFANSWRIAAGKEDINYLVHFSKTH